MSDDIKTSAETPTKCDHLGQGGPCVRNPTVAVSDFCGPCWAALAALKGRRNAKAKDAFAAGHAQGVNDAQAAFERLLGGGS